MSERPAGITVIAILVAIQGSLGILTGLEATGITSLGLGAAAGSESAGSADIFVGIVTLLVSYGLFMTRGWAWSVAVIITVIRIVTGALAVLISGIGSAIGLSGVAAIVIGLVILGYLRRRDVREAFDR
jgi:hypothetical protein